MRGTYRTLVAIPMPAQLLRNVRCRSANRFSPTTFAYSAFARRLTIRPFADTVRETIAFYKAQTPVRQAALRAGLTPKREKEVLAAWHASQRSS